MPIDLETGLHLQPVKNDVMQTFIEREQRPLINLTFLPQNVTVSVRAGDTVLDAALDNGIELPHECGGNCACTTCHIHILAGAEHLSEIEDVEADRLTSAENLASDSRLGCQAILRGGAVTVQIMEQIGDNKPS